MVQIIVFKTFYNQVMFGIEHVFARHRTSVLKTLFDSKSYSVLKLLTGFAIAALIAWKLIVTTVIITAIVPAITNTTGLITIL